MIVRFSVDLAIDLREAKMAYIEDNECQNDWSRRDASQACFGYSSQHITPCQVSFHAMLFLNLQILHGKLYGCHCDMCCIFTVDSMLHSFEG